MSERKGVLEAEELSKNNKYKIKKFIKMVNFATKINKKMEYIIRNTDTANTLELKGSEDQVLLFSEISKSLDLKAKIEGKSLWIYDVQNPEQLMTKFKAKGANVGIAFNEIVKMKQKEEAKPEMTDEKTPALSDPSTKKDEGKPEEKAKAETESWKEGTVLTRWNKVWIIKPGEDGKLQVYCHDLGVWRFCDCKKHTIGTISKEEKPQAEAVINNGQQAPEEWKQIGAITNEKTGEQITGEVSNIHKDEEGNTRGDIKVSPEDARKIFEGAKAPQAEALTEAPIPKKTFRRGLRIRPGIFWLHPNEVINLSIGVVFQYNAETGEVIFKVERMADEADIKIIKEHGLFTESGEPIKPEQKAESEKTPALSDPSTKKDEEKPEVIEDFVIKCDDCHRSICACKTQAEAAAGGVCDECKTKRLEKRKAITEEAKEKKAKQETEVKFNRGDKINDEFICVSKKFCISVKTEMLHTFNNITGKVFGEFGPADNVDKRVLPVKEKIPDIKTDEHKPNQALAGDVPEAASSRTEFDRIIQSGRKTDEEQKKCRIEAAENEKLDREDALAAFTDIQIKPQQTNKNDMQIMPAKNVDQKLYLKSLMTVFEPETVQLVKDLRRRIILSLEDDMYITYKTFNKKETLKQGHDVYNYSTTITKEGATYIAQMAHVTEVFDKTVATPIMNKKGDAQIGWEVTGIVVDESGRYTVATGRCTTEDKGKSWMSGEQILAMARTRFFINAIRKHFRLFNFHAYILKNDIPPSSISNQ